MASASGVAPTQANGPWSPRQFHALTALALVAAVFLRALVLLRGDLSGQLLAAAGAVYTGEPGMPASPIERLLTSVALALAPMEYWPIALCLLLLWMAYCTAAWIACRSLTTSPSVRLVLLVLAVYTPMALPGMSAWPLGVESGCIAIGVLLTTHGAVRLHATGHLRDSWTMSLGTLIALAGSSGWPWSPALLVPVWAAVLAFLPLLPGAPRWSDDGARPTKSEVIAASIPLALGVASILVSGRSPLGPMPRDLGRIAGFVGESVGSGLIPSLAGGPVAWTAQPDAWPLADASGWISFLGLQVILLGLASCVFLTRRGLLAWGVGLVFAGLSLAFFAMSTGPAVVGSGKEMLALAPVPAYFLLAAAAAMTAPGLRWPFSWPGRHQLPVAAFVATDLFLALSIMSTFTWSDSRTPYLGEEYVKAATTSLSSAAPQVSVLAQVVPPEVADPRYAPLNRTDVIFAPVPERPPFAPWTTALQAFDNEGVLRPALLKGIKASITCTTWAPDITLSQVLPEFTYVIAIDLTTPARDGYGVQLGSGPAVVVPPGVEETTVYVQVTGRGNAIALAPLGDESLCPRSVRVGQLEVLEPEGEGTQS
jgi:hypothetical protein